MVTSYHLVKTARQTAFRRRRRDAIREFGHLNHDVACMRRMHHKHRMAKHTLKKVQARLRTVLLAMHEKSKMLKGPAPNPWAWYIAFSGAQPGEDIETYERGPRLRSEDFHHVRPYEPENAFFQRRARLKHEGKYALLHRLAKRQGDQDSKALLKSAIANRRHTTPVPVQFTEMDDAAMLGDMAAVAERVMHLSLLKIELFQKRVLDTLHYARQPMRDPRGTPRLLPRLSLAGSAAVMPMTQMGASWAPPYSSAEVPPWAAADALFSRETAQARSEKQLNGCKNKGVVGRSVSQSPPPLPPGVPLSLSSSHLAVPPDTQSILSTRRSAKRKRGAGGTPATYTFIAEDPAQYLAMTSEDEDGDTDDDDDEYIGSC